MVFSRLAVVLRTMALPVLLMVIVPHVHANLLPMTDLAQLSWRRHGIAACLTTGSYDTTSMVWREEGSTPCTAATGRNDALVRIVGFEPRLIGRVDNDGNALGGTFTAFGAIPSLGIDEPRLLMRGSLIDAFYGPPLVTESIRGGIGANALVELDFALPMFGNAGDILLWWSYATVRGWIFGSQSPGTMPWHSSVDESDYHNYTYSDFFIFDRRAFFAPEPATLALLGLGIWLVLARARSASIRTSKPPSTAGSCQQV